MCYVSVSFFFCSSRRRHTRCALVTGVQTCALPISKVHGGPVRNADRVLTQQAARRYLARLIGLHLGAVLVCIGFLIAVAGAPTLGVPAMATDRTRVV